MTTRNKIDLELIDRYLAGESSPHEQARLRVAADADPRVRELIAALPPATRSPEATSWDTDRAWARLQAGEQSGQPADQPARSPRTFPWLRLAAMLVVGLALVVVWRSCTRQSPRASSEAGLTYTAAPWTPWPPASTLGTSVLQPVSYFTLLTEF